MYDPLADAITEEIPRPDAPPPAATVLRSRGTPGPVLVQLVGRPRAWEAPEPVTLRRVRMRLGSGG